MTYYTDALGAEAPLMDFTPSLGLSIGAAAADAFESNPTRVASEYARFRSANAEERMPNDEAQRRIKEAGVKLKVPDDGFSAPALDLLIERKRDEIARQSVLNRAPASVVGTSGRFLTQIAVSLLDPLNIATAFVPVVGQARYGVMLGKAGGALGRAGVRAAVGAAEGAVGAALVEPLLFVGRTQLQDDYSMADSLANIAFGSVFGGGLHVAGGAVADAFRPSARRLPDAGTSDLPAHASAEPRVATEPAAPLVREIERERVPLAIVQDAPFPKRWEVSPEGARVRALDEMGDSLRAELLAEAGGRAEPGAIAGVKRELADAQARLQQLDSPTEAAARLAEFQTEGVTRKEAKELARKAIEVERKDLQATASRLEQSLETNATAARAEQDIAKLADGKVPERFEARVAERAAQIEAAAQMERVVTGNLPPVRFEIGMASPEVREGALRAAVAHAMEGRMPVVEPIVRPGADPVATARAAGEQLAAPESVLVADFPAARAADERIAAAPTPETAAEASLQAHMERLDDLMKNLEQRGTDPERVKAMRAELEPFEEALKDAKRLGEAMRAAAICGVRA